MQLYPRLDVMAATGVRRDEHLIEIRSDQSADRGSLFFWLTNCAIQVLKIPLKND